MTRPAPVMRAAAPLSPKEWWFDASIRARMDLLKKAGLDLDDEELDLELVTRKFSDFPSGDQQKLAQALGSAGMQAGTLKAAVYPTETVEQWYDKLSPSMKKSVVYEPGYTFENARFRELPEWKRKELEDFWKLQSSAGMHANVGAASTLPNGVKRATAAAPGGFAVEWNDGTSWQVAEKEPGGGAPAAIFPTEQEARRFMETMKSNFRRDPDTYGTGAPLRVVPSKGGFSAAKPSKPKRCEKCGRDTGQEDDPLCSRCQGDAEDFAAQPIRPAPKMAAGDRRALKPKPAVVVDISRGGSPLYSVVRDYGHGPITVEGGFESKEEAQRIADTVNRSGDRNPW